jgi:hypothetical protein
MRANLVLLGYVIALSSGLIVQTPAVSQEYRGTQEQQMACTPDVWRLCGAQVPDVGRIVACLRRNASQLSAPCRAAVEQTDNARGRSEDNEQRRYGRNQGPRRYDRDYVPRRYEYDDE